MRRRLRGRLLEELRPHGGDGEGDALGRVLGETEQGLEVGGEGGGLGGLGGEGGELRPCEGDVQLDELLEVGVGSGSGLG